MNNKKVKKLRRFAKLKGIPYKRVRKAFRRLTITEQKILLKEVIGGKKE